MMFHVKPLITHEGFEAVFGPQFPSPIISSSSPILGNTKEKKNCFTVYTYDTSLAYNYEYNNVKQNIIIDRGMQIVQVITISTGSKMVICVFRYTLQQVNPLFPKLPLPLFLLGIHILG